MSCYYNNITSYDIDYRYNNCVYYDNTDKTLLFSYDTHMSLLDIIRVAVPILDHQVLKPNPVNSGFWELIFGGLGTDAM